MTATVARAPVATTPAFLICIVTPCATLDPQLPHIGLKRHNNCTLGNDSLINQLLWERAFLGTQASASAGYFLDLPSGDSEVDKAAMKASCGTSTRPTIFIRFLPSFCFSSSLRLRLMSPP